MLCISQKYVCVCKLITDIWVDVIFMGENPQYLLDTALLKGRRDASPYELKYLSEEFNLTNSSGAEFDIVC